MLEKIRAAITVLYRGNELANAAAWKNRQSLFNALLAFLGAASVFLPHGVEVAQDDLAAIAGGIAAFAGLFNAYLTNATSRKVGLSAGGEDHDRPEQTDHSDQSPFLREF